MYGSKKIDNHKRLLALVYLLPNSDILIEVFPENTRVRRSHGRCSKKFGKFHKKTPVFGSLFNKVAGLENTCIGVSFLIKLQAFRSATLLKRDSQHTCFPVKFAKFLRTPANDCF